MDWEWLWVGGGCAAAHVLIGVLVLRLVCAISPGGINNFGWPPATRDRLLFVGIVALWPVLVPLAAWSLLARRGRTGPSLRS